MPSPHTKTHTAHQQSSMEETVSLEDYNAIKYMSNADYDAIKERRMPPSTSQKPPPTPEGHSGRVSLEEFKALQEKREAEWRSRKPSEPQTLHDKLFPGRVPFPSLLDYSDPKKMEAYRDKLRAKAAAKHPQAVQSTPLRSTQHTKTHAVHKQDSPKTETVSQREYDALKDMSDGEYDAIREYRYLNWKSTQPAHQPPPSRLSADSSARVSLEEFEALQDKRYADYQSRKSTDQQTLHDKLFPGRVPYPSLSDYSDPKKMEAYRDKLRAKAAAEHPPKAQSTPLPDSDTPHQPYFDPLKNQEKNGKTFLTDLDVRLSHDSTRALLEQNFQAKPAAKGSPKQQAGRVMDKMTLHLKDYFKSKPSQTDYEPLKADFLEKLLTENDITDKPTQESISAYMDRTGKQLNAYQEVSDQYHAGQLKAYQLKFKNLNDIYQAQSEIMGAQQIFQGGYMLGTILNEPTLMKSAQVGLAVGNAILCATRIAESNLKDIGTLALTGNWVGLFMSLASSIFPFFSQSGPTIAEVTLDYLQQSVQHIVDHFGQVYLRFDQVGYMQKQMMELLHTIIDSLQQMGKTQYGYHKSAQSSLNTIKVLVKDLSELMGDGFEVSHFEEFYNIIGQAQDVLEKKGTDYQSVQRLLNALVRNYITQMSENDYHTGQRLFDAKRFNYLTPQIETLTFSAHSPIDREFVTHDETRLEQRVRLEAVFGKMDSNNTRFLGFHAAYVKALLADELMDAETIDAHIAQTHLEKKATSRAIKTLNTTLSHYVANQDVTPEAKKAHDGDVKELASLKHRVTHATRRLVQLHSLKAQAILTEEAQKKQTTLQTEQAQQIEEKKQHLQKNIQELQQKANALDAVMKPVLPLSKEQFTNTEDAKNWIQTHQELEFAEAQLVLIEHEQTEYALTCHLARTQGRPSFKPFSPLIWETGVAHYLDLLETQNSTSFSPHIHGRDLDIMILMADNQLYFIEYLQSKPQIAEDLWRGYANTLLTIHASYREDYQIYLANLTQTAAKKDSAELNNMVQRELKTVVDAGSTRVEEGAFVSEILLDSTVLNVKYQGYFSFLDTQKKLLRMHCQLAGGSSELINAIDGLFDQKNITEQLKDLVTYANKPVLFTTDLVYEHINQVYGVLENEMIQPHRVLPPPSMTNVGAPIAATLQRLRKTKSKLNWQHIHEQLAKSHYSLTFTNNVMQNTTEMRETPMPLENATFIEVAQKAIDSVADMSDTENAVIYVGASGAGKDVAVADALGCELRYVKVDGDWRLEIVTCPKNVTWPEISHTPASKTLTPKVYTEVGQDNPLRFLNLPGFFDNRGNATSLLAMLGTQVAIKKARKIKAVVITLRDTDLDSRCSGFDKIIDILSMIFKQSIAFYGEALKLHIGLSRDDEPSKEDIIERLKAYQQYIQARVAEEPTPLNRNKEQLVSVFLAHENNIFLFKPGESRAEFLENVRNTTPFEAAELELVGTSAMKQELMSQMDSALIEGNQLFDRLLTTPQKIAALLKKEQRLVKWLSDYTEIAENKTVEQNGASQEAGSESNIQLIKETIGDILQEINETNIQVNALNATRQKITHNITTLLANRALTTFDTLEHDELLENMKATGQPLCTKEHYDNYYAHNRYPMTLQCIEKNRLYRHVPSERLIGPHKGEPFTYVKVTKMTMDCKDLTSDGKVLFRGGYSGTYTPTANGPAGTFQATYKPPQSCYFEYKIEFQRPYNEGREQKSQLKFWDADLETNGQEQRDLKAHLQTLKRTLSEARKNLVSTITTQVKSDIQRSNSNHLALENTAKINLVSLNHTRQALSALQELDNQTCTTFYRKQPSYQTIQTLNEVLDFNSTLYQTFFDKYALTRQFLNITMTNNTATDGPQNTSQPEAHCMPEEDDTTSFGIPGARASSIHCITAPKLIGTFTEPSVRMIGDNTTQPQSSQLLGFVERMHRHRKTAKLVYTVNFYNPASEVREPIGHIDLYGTSTLCRTLDGRRTNVIASKGVFPTSVMDPDTTDVICNEAPPKSSSLTDPIIGGATNGFLRGAANVVGKAISPANFTKEATYVVQSLVHDAFHLTMRSQAHYSAGKPLETALYDAAIETAQMQAMSLSTLIVSYLGQKAKAQGWKKIGGALNFFARAIPYVHMGIQQEIIHTDEFTGELKLDTDKLIDEDFLYETGASVMSAMIVQNEVEHYGNQLFSRGPQ